MQNFPASKASCVAELFEIMDGAVPGQALAGGTSTQFVRGIAGAFC
jgi:hypothetical protein